MRLGSRTTVAATEKTLLLPQFPESCARGSRVTALMSPPSPEVGFLVLHHLRVIRIPVDNSAFLLMQNLTSEAS